MTDRDKGRLVMPFLMLGGLCIFLAGIGWGLPSRRSDSLLFGDQPVWTGKEISTLAGDRPDTSLGADVDPNPVVPGERPVLLNGTDAQRAEIVRRYRLYTYQPDEMITLMSLATMRPGEGQLDPKLYQYGGLWIYPIGAMLKVASQLKLITLVSSQEYYLDHPEQFALFYVVARLYAVMWAMIGIWAVFRLASNAGAGTLAATGAAMLYMSLPVVVNMSHEAKPHLPGAVLMLLAALAAGKFVESGKHRWWIITAGLCGAAMGMVLTGVLAMVILPVMLWMREMSNRRRLWMLGCAGVIAVGVYFTSNPYVLGHLLGDQGPLESNLANSRAMYQLGDVGAMFYDAGRLVVEGAGPVTAAAGIIAAIALMLATLPPRAAGVRILIILCGLILLQFILLAAEKSAEYGRFAILPDIVLALSAAVWIGRAKIRTFERVEALSLLLVLTMLPSVIYIRGFLQDSGPSPRRLQDARMLDTLHEMGARTLGVYDDPAPYVLPPVDLFAWKIEKLPVSFNVRTSPALVDVIVRPVDRLEQTPLPSDAYEQLSEQRVDDIFPAQISWAHKPMQIWLRKNLVSPAATSGVSE